MGKFLFELRSSVSWRKRHEPVCWGVDQQDEFLCLLPRWCKRLKSVCTPVAQGREYLWKVHSWVPWREQYGPVCCRRAPSQLEERLELLDWVSGWFVVWSIFIMMIVVVNRFQYCVQYCLGEKLLWFLRDGSGGTRAGDEGRLAQCDV